MAATFKVKVGAFAVHKGERYVVIEMKNLDDALCRSLTTKSLVTLPINELSEDIGKRLATTPLPLTQDLVRTPDAQWAVATQRLDLIRGLEKKGRHQRTRADFEEVGNALGKSWQTIYRWLNRYEQDGTITAFLTRERADKGDGRLSEEVEDKIQEAIRRLLLKREFGTLKDVHRDIKRYCDGKKIKPPAVNTIRDRFLKITEKERVSSRQGKKVAKEKFTPLRGSFPGADHPWDVIQIDHTPADLIIVDDIYRKPIGRPTITMAIDVNSRVVVGFNMWLEAPSAAATSLCLLHAMLPKEKWLEKCGVKHASWPCYGKPRKIHTDNAKEFRGAVLGRACKSYGIDLEQRPKGQPHFGGHVERGFRTFLQKTHTLSGTTFSNVRSKFDYDSEGRAILTLAEFEYWFTVYLVKLYHVDIHGGLQTTPLQRYEEGILGVDGKIGIGMPERFNDTEKLRLDFLPYVERTVQEYGVQIDHVHYYDDVLRSHIHERDPDNPKSKKLHLFRRDPRDVSVIYFWDPDTKTYREIPYAHRGRAPASLWEVRAAIREQIAKGRAAVDENSIFEGIDEMREIERKAAVDTKTARRNEQRRRESAKVRSTKKTTKLAEKLIVEEPNKELPKSVVKADPDDEIIIAFDDIDMRS